VYLDAGGAHAPQFLVVETNFLLDKAVGGDGGSRPSAGAINRLPAASFDGGEALGGGFDLVAGSANLPTFKVNGGAVMGCSARGGTGGAGASGLGLSQGGRGGDSYGGGGLVDITGSLQSSSVSVSIGGTFWMGHVWFLDNTSTGGTGGNGGSTLSGPGTRGGNGGDGSGGNFGVLKQFVRASNGLQGASTGFESTVVSSMLYMGHAFGGAGGQGGNGARGGTGGQGRGGNAFVSVAPPDIFAHTIFDFVSFTAGLAQGGQGGRGGNASSTGGDGGDGGNGYGGGIYAESAGGVMLNYELVTANSAKGGAGGARGGGFHLGHIGSAGTSAGGGFAAYSTKDSAHDLALSPPTRIIDNSADTGPDVDGNLVGI
jgi:hypothetical protein